MFPRSEALGTQLTSRPMLPFTALPFTPLPFTHTPMADLQDDFDDFLLTEEDLHCIKIRENEFLSQMPLPSAISQEPGAAYNASSSPDCPPNAQAAWQWKDTSFSNLNVQINKVKLENERLSRELQILRQEQMKKCGEISILRERQQNAEREAYEAKVQLVEHKQEFLQHESSLEKAKEEEIKRLKSELQFKEQELYAAQVNLRSLKRPIAAVLATQVTAVANTQNSSQSSLALSPEKRNAKGLQAQPLAVQETVKPSKKLAFLKERIVSILESCGIAFTKELYCKLNEAGEPESLIEFVRLAYPTACNSQMNALFCLFSTAGNSPASGTCLKHLASLCLKGSRAQLKSFFEHEAIAFIEAFTFTSTPNALENAFHFAVLLYCLCLYEPSEGYLFFCRMDQVKFTKIIDLLLKVPLELMCKILLAMLFQCHIEIDRVGANVHKITTLLLGNNCVQSRGSGREHQQELLSLFAAYTTSL